VVDRHRRAAEPPRSACRAPSSKLGTLMAIAQLPPSSYNAQVDYLFAAIIFVFIVAVLYVLWKREHPKKG
jgi:hypothetical protein